jgi:FkbM family methyltransferase
MIKKIYINFINILVINIIKILVYSKNKIRRIRKIEFEYFSDKYRLYYNKYFFIIFGKDKFISRETYVNGPHDYHLFKKVKFLLNKKINYLIDVGANIGTFCIPPIKDGLIEKCIAIEPVKKIFNILNVNIILNEVEKKIITYDYVISDNKNENLSLSLNKNNYGDNKFQVSLKKNKNQFKIIKLDYFIKQFNCKELLIKIDVQGFEDKVLISGSKFFFKKVPLIIEFDRSFFKKKHFKKIFKLFKNNYNYFSILDEKYPKQDNIKNFVKIFNNTNKKIKHINCLIF